MSFLYLKLIDFIFRKRNEDTELKCFRPTVQSIAALEYIRPNK